MHTAGILGSCCWGCTTPQVLPLRVQDVAAAALDRYGVGACGPRAFYGTIDVHLTLEARLAAFMGVEEAILYSYDVATMPSVMPAFASRKDLIVIDEACAWPQHNGALLSRAKGAPPHTHALLQCGLAPIWAGAHRRSLVSLRGVLHESDRTVFYMWPSKPTCGRRAWQVFCERMRLV